MNKTCLGLLFVAIFMLGSAAYADIISPDRNAPATPHPTPTPWPESRVAPEVWKQALADARAIAQREWSTRPAHPQGLQDFTPSQDPAPLIARAIAQLGSSDKDEAKAAEEVLLYLGDLAMDGCRAALVHPDPKVRSQCAIILSKRGEKAVAMLSEAWRREKSAEVRGTILSALRFTGSPNAIPVFLEALNDSEDEVRANAVDAFGQYPDARAFEPLVKLIKSDRNGGIRLEAARNLALIDFKKASPVLRKIADENNDLSQFRIMTEFGDLQATCRHLAAVPREDYHFHPTAAQREFIQLATDALTVHGESFTTREIERLMIAIPPNGKKLERGDDLMLVYAVKGLAQLRANRAADQILNHENPRVRLQYSSWFPRTETVDLLAPLALSNDPKEREDAVRCMMVGTATWGIPLLVALLDDSRLFHFYNLDSSHESGRFTSLHQALVPLAGHFHGISFYSPFEAFDMKRAIPAYKTWWQKNRVDYLAGKAIPKPPPPEAFITQPTVSYEAPAKRIPKQ